MGMALARLGRWIVAAGLVSAAFAGAQTPVPLPITGNLGSISGSPQPYVGVLIQLQNCASPVAVTGYFGIVATAYQLQANASGQINSSVWPNDLITCNGTTGASMYSVQLIVAGVPSGTTQCYQVVSTQGVWNMNTQQPVPCGFTPPNPQDATFRNLNVTGFFQGNNGAMTGTWTVYGLLTAAGGIQLGSTPTPCGTGNYMSGITNTLQPVCTALPAPPTGFLTSFNGRSTPAVLPATGDYNYGMISGTPTFGATPAPPTGLTNVVWQSSGATNSAYVPATAITAGACALPASVTFGADGRATACTPGPSFTGSSGYQVLPTGLILEWGETSNFDSGPTTVTFPLAFPHGCLMIPQLTGNRDVSATTREWNSGSCTTTGFQVGNDGSGQAHYFVIGW